MRSTLLKILSSRWLVSEELASSFFMQLWQHQHQGLALALDPPAAEAFAALRLPVAGVAASQGPQGSSSPDQRYIAAIPIRGVLMKEDQACGPVGMATLARAVAEHRDNPQCIGALFHVDSPGGSVDGTSQLGSCIAGFGKPTIALVDGMAASAGYWLASQCDRVYALDRLTTLGSIGVQFTAYDYDRYLESQGLPVFVVKSDGSPDKNDLISQLRRGELGEIKAQLNYIRQEFLAAIGAKRTVAEGACTGRMYFAEEAEPLGLIDGIRTEEACVAELVASHQASTSNPSNTIATMKKQYARVNAALQVEALESVDEHVALNEGQVASLEAALEAGEGATAQAEALTGTLAERDATIADLTAQLTGSQATVAAQAAQIVALQGKGARGASASGNTHGEAAPESVADRERRLAALAETDFSAYLQAIKED